jgi:hypothetical protein
MTHEIIIYFQVSLYQDKDYQSIKYLDNIKTNDESFIPFTVTEHICSEPKELEYVLEYLRKNANSDSTSDIYMTNISYSEYEEAFQAIVEVKNWLDNYTIKNKYMMVNILNEALWYYRDSNSPFIITIDEDIFEMFISIQQIHKVSTQKDKNGLQNIIQIFPHQEDESEIEINNNFYIDMEYDIYTLEHFKWNNYFLSYLLTFRTPINLKI